MHTWHPVEDKQTPIICCSLWCSLQHPIYANMVYVCMYLSDGCPNDLRVFVTRSAIARVGAHWCACINMCLCMHVPVCVQLYLQQGMRSFQPSALTCHMFTGKHVVGRESQWCMWYVHNNQWLTHNMNITSNSPHTRRHGFILESKTRLMLCLLTAVLLVHLVQIWSIC